MKRCSKLICVLLLMAMAFSLIACGTTSSTTSTSSSTVSSSQATATAASEPSADKPAEEKTFWRPTGVVEMLVPSTAGSGHDTAARAFAQAVEDATGVKINIVNESSGGGAVAFTEGKNADPDGYTLLQAGTALITDQYNNPDCTYNQDTYRLVCNITTEGMHLFVSTKGPFADMDLEQFIEYAKNNDVSIAVSGTWSQGDNVRYKLQDATGIKFTRVGIKGGANCVLAVIAGDVDCCFVTPTDGYPQAQAGNVKALAQTAKAHNAFFPDVMTFTELGYPTVYMPSFRFVTLPLNTPDEIYEGWCEIIRQTYVDNAEHTGELFLQAGCSLNPVIGQEGCYEMAKDYDDALKWFQEVNAYAEEF